MFSCQNKEVSVKSVTAPMRKDGVPVGSAERLVWTLWLLQMLGWLYQGSCEIKLGVQLGRCVG